MAVPYPPHYTATVKFIVYCYCFVDMALFGIIIVHRDHLRSRHTHDPQARRHRCANLRCAVATCADDSGGYSRSMSPSGLLTYRRFVSFFGEMECLIWSKGVWMTKRLGGSPFVGVSPLQFHARLMGTSASGATLHRIIFGTRPLCEDFFLFTRSH